MAKIRDVDTPKKKRRSPGKPIRKGYTGKRAKNGEGKKSKARKKIRKSIDEDEQENTGETGVDRDSIESTHSTKKKGKASKKKVHGKPVRDKKGRVVRGSTLNPNGRPKGAVSLTAILREKLAQVPPGEKRTRGEMLIDTLMDHAVEVGDHKMIKEVLDRIEGKVPDRLIAAVGTGELAGISDDILLAAIGAEKGEKEEPVEEPVPNPQDEPVAGPESDQESVDGP